jgi:tetratricopeptide (TPR) repeat protein
VQLINWGINRWAFKPEFGYSGRRGNWVLDASAGAWFYTINSAEFHIPHPAPQTEEPIGSFECHLSRDFVGRGDMEKGLAQLRDCKEADPLSTFTWRLLADALYLASDFEGCIAVCREGLQLHPGCGLLHRTLSRASTAIGEYDQARRHLRREWAINDRPQTGTHLEIAYLDAVTGNREAAVAFLSQLERQHHFSPIPTAEIYLALGNKQRALNYVEQACRTRHWSTAGLKHNRRLDSLRNTMRFRSALAWT